MRFFGILLIIILAWYAIKFIGRLAMPYIVNRLSKRMMNNMTGNQNTNFEEQRKKEGEVSIKDTRQKKNNPVDDKGEYIDYEEIE